MHTQCMQKHASCGKLNHSNHSIQQVHDVEDLHKVGKRHGACPYYASRHLAQTADLVFCPYRCAAWGCVLHAAVVWYHHQLCCEYIRALRLRAHKHARILNRQLPAGSRDPARDRR